MDEDGLALGGRGVARHKWQAHLTQRRDVFRPPLARVSLRTPSPLPKVSMASPSSTNAAGPAMIQSLSKGHSVAGASIRPICFVKNSRHGIDRPSLLGGPREGSSSVSHPPSYFGTRLSLMKRMSGKRAQLGTRRQRQERSHRRGSPCGFGAVVSGRVHGMRCLRRVSRRRHFQARVSIEV